MTIFSEILVPVDFSEASELALTHAKRLAEVYGSKVHLVHVMEDSFLYAQDVSEAYRAPFEKEAKDKLRELLTDEEFENLDVQIGLTSGKAFAAIIDYAKTHSCDLIVIASHGRGAAAHMIIGSVAENVLRTAHCPVYVVREKDHGVVEV